MKAVRNLVLIVLGLAAAGLVLAWTFLGSATVEKDTPFTIPAGASVGSVATARPHEPAAPEAFTLSALSRSWSKKARHSPETDAGSAAHFSCRSSMNEALEPYRKLVSAKTWFSRPASSAIVLVYSLAPADTSP
mgnify:CR=1 FL=1